MPETLPSSARDQWYVIDALADVPLGRKSNRLLGTHLVTNRAGDGAIGVTEADTGRPLPARERYGCLWTTLGAPDRDPPAIPEADEADRRPVMCGAIMVRASGPRVIENFLDMAHFPFVHTDILGAEPLTEVLDYTSEIRRDVDEVWATECRFFQPRAALSASEGIMTRYLYRVATPFATLLYKTCPQAPERWDVICLFVQPLDPDRCRAHPVMFLIDETAALTDLVHFQQTIFLQDRIILENQRPRLLPLEPRAEIPTRCDGLSVAYRRWLREKGMNYGTTIRPVAA
jgi:phenylpropionate dioxygenase-like ring-hydroxylating dioxygenase large terminal subunit